MKNIITDKKLEKKTDQNEVEVTLGIENLKIAEPTGPIKFVANTIMYVEGEESEESSEEDYNILDEKSFNFNPKEKKELPYRTFTIKESKAKKTLKEEKISTPAGFAKETSIFSKDLGLSKSNIVQPFLDNLYTSGLELRDTEKIDNIVSVSIGLNRPLSLSTRKNNLLFKELEASTDSVIPHMKFGMFWEYKWYDSQNKKTNYSTVKSFYKKLKKFDKNKAEEFRNVCEKGIAVPYQELRELLKNHANTKFLVKKFRESDLNENIYLSFIDGDTKSFNGIYSAYLRIYKGEKIPPTIMSTGYEFTEEKAGDYPFVEGSKLCRAIRVATAKHLPLSVYYTEPNVCVLVPANQDTIPSSFIDKTIKRDGVIIKNAESVALIRNILKSEHYQSVNAVFSNDNPILTTIPPRVKVTKVGKNPIEFSGGFKLGMGPIEQDIRLFKQMSQSHVHEGVWLDNLYINKGINITTGEHFKFKGLVTKYLESNVTELELIELLKLVSQATLELIKSAYTSKEKVVSDYKIKNLRSLDIQEFLNYIEFDLKLDIKEFTRDYLEVIATAKIIDLLKNELLNLTDLSQFSIEDLKEILGNQDVIENIREEAISCDDLLELQVITQNYRESFSEVLMNFLGAIEQALYSASEILEKYREDSLHIKYMVDDPYEVFQQDTDSMDEHEYRFVLDNDYLDSEQIQEIMSEMGETELMDFRVAIGDCEEDWQDEEAEEYYSQEDVEGLGVNPLEEN